MKSIIKTAASVLILSTLYAGTLTAQDAAATDTDSDTTTDTSSVITASDTDVSSDLSSDFGSFATSDDSTESQSSLSVNGTADLKTRAMLDQTDVDSVEDIKDLPTTVTPSLKLNLDYSAPVTELTASIKMDTTTIEDHPEDILNEFTARAFLGNFVLEAGKMKLVWGKGDKVHVIDNFNANDYTDFLIPDYIDRRIAEPMMHIVWNGPSSLRAEAVYTPMMTADRFATSGYWTPSSYTSLVSTVTSVESNIVGTALSNKDTALVQYASGSGTKAAYTAALASYLEALNTANSISSDDLLPDTNTLKYGQAGLRLTGTLGPVDLGASYYYGHYKQPSVNLADYLSTSGYSLPELEYDRLQVFGLEAAGIAGPLNLRGEFAYNLTEDTTGDNPWIHNNSLAWVGGFDIDLPVSNLNVNIQETGTYILKNNEIDNGSYKTVDVDYNSDGKYTSDELVAAITDSYNHEKIKTELDVIWGIEYTEFMVMPKLTVNVGDGLNVTASGLWINSDDSNGVFADYDKNSYVQLGAEYTF